MTTASIPERRKHIYFYTFLILGTILVAGVKLPQFKPADATTRATEANKVANTLFR